MIFLDVAVCQPYIFGQCNDFNQMFENFTLTAVGVQLILNFLKVIILEPMRVY